MKTPLKDNFYDFYGVLSVPHGMDLYGTRASIEKKMVYRREKSRKYDK